jgi:hypothetical protein
MMLTMQQSPSRLRQTSITEPFAGASSRASPPSGWRAYLTHYQLLLNDGARMFELGTDRAHRTEAAD